jgi:PII-like signaling protein
MATDSEVAKLKSEIGKLKVYLRRQNVWEKKVVANTLRRLRRQSGLTGPTVTDPPRPPRP